MDNNQKITAAIFSFDSSIAAKIISSLTKIKLIERIIVISKNEISDNTISLIKADHPFGCNTIRKVIEKTLTPYLLFINGSKHIELIKDAVNNFISQAGWVYSDYYEKQSEKLILHPLIDYQTGSVRDDFDFGNCFMIRTDLAKTSLPNLFSQKNNFLYSGLYDLRLSISSRSSVVRIPEPLYSVQSSDETSKSNKIFDYVNPKNREVQIEMEKVFTHHLREIGAYVDPKKKKSVSFEDKFNCEASVIIPVKNRVNTIGDSINSALKQKTKFNFNIIISFLLKPRSFLFMKLNCRFANRVQQINEIEITVQNIDLITEREELFTSFDSIFMKLFPRFI